VEHFNIALLLSYPHFPLVSLAE